MESPEKAVLRPKIAVLTPIVPDHQNWYGNMDAYVADKKIIYQGQDAEGWTICSRCDGWGERFAAETKARVLWYSDSPLPKELSGAWTEQDGTAIMRFPFDGDRASYLRDSENLGSQEERPILPARLTVPGKHMKQNIMNAGQVLAVMGVTPERIADVLVRFPGVEHRLEFFHRWQSGDGRAEMLFYNDSAATVPEAAAAAVEAFDMPLIMICGGTDKELDFTPLAAALPRAEKIYLLAGSGTEKLVSLLKQQGTAYEGPFSSLEETLRAVRKALPPEGRRIAVLSPGAASFGMFVNEFDRGNRFREAVRKVFP
jgi:UDP-N-acetylmuramoylalanine--D-glutamate ligase